MAFRNASKAGGGEVRWSTATRDTLRQGLRDLGYIEGQNLLLESRYADWQPDRLPALAAELVRLHPDVIYTWSTPGVLAAQQATTTIPIVAVAGGLMHQGRVASLERPGGNITGVTTFSAELYGKQLELLKEAAPQTSPKQVVISM